MSWIPPAALAAFLGVCLVAAHTALSPVLVSYVRTLQEPGARTPVTADPAPADVQAGSGLQVVPGTETGPAPAAAQVTRPWLVGPASVSAWCAATCLLVLLAALTSQQWLLACVAGPLVTSLTGACLVDACCHRLPNKVLGPAALIALGGWVLVAVVRLAHGAGTWAAAVLVATCLLGGVVTGLVLLLMALVPSGLGLGDVKLGGVLGLWLAPLGGDVIASAVVGGLVLAGLAAIMLMAARRVERHHMIAMGPYLLLGALAAWFLALV